MKQDGVRRWMSSVSVKLALWLIASMALVFALLGYQTLQLHKRDLEQMTIMSADRTSDVIKRGLRYSMLQNHRDEIYHTLLTIGAQPGIHKIRIFDKEGRISFSTDAREMNTFVDKRAEACYACHAQEQPLARLERPDRVRVYVGDRGERILGLINPIENEPGCYTAPCHAHTAAQSVLGVLDVTLSLAPVDAAIAEGQRQLLRLFLISLLFVALVVVAVTVTMIHVPIKHLKKGTERVAAGDLDYKIPLTSRDELGELAASFNAMTEELKRAHEEVLSWARTLEERVAQKTAELRRAHEQMLHAERMASIGKLAAIVAHEINNPLSGILTTAKLLLKKMRDHGLSAEDLASARQYLELIANESARCGEIVKNLLQFVRPSRARFQPHDVNALIHQSLRLIQHKIELMSLQTNVHLDPSLPPIVCDGQQIQQALVALLINACEAMQPEEGVLEVRSRFLPETQRVEIAIRDNGVGMDEETQRHIFEPFFTTKEKEGSLGLGLSVVLSILHRHGGEIHVQSALGQGTTFTLHLPLTPPSHEEERADLAFDLSSTAAPSGAGQSGRNAL
ncbi:MAG: ATP-binding protein [Blastocatellia bacterium]|nr:ATP-binding protein [Blastocatellia bacterium]MCS7156255.1 ATP-binding protein [Blastocatellia bacterium]MCX7751395.1 ATP-binding protein [Blastocatellia bacterium]MDW8169108.1 ATP-binding protein [Acidobacteriota bacterium]MDW8255812.1 ATP-binding protein [Acidobacteriota bacterium]